MDKKYLLVFGILIFLVSIQFVYAIENSVWVGDYKLTFEYSGVEEDDSFTLTVKVNNTDNKIKEGIVFDIDDSDPFDVDGDTNWNIGTLGINEEDSKSYRIDVDDNTRRGDYSLDFILEDDDGSYDDHIKIEVSSTEADLIIGDVRSVPLTISPDQEDVKLEVTVNNIGGGDADFVRAKLLLPDGIIASNSYSDSATTSTISSDENEIFVFYIDTEKNLSSGNLIANLVLEYETKSDSKSQRLEFSIPVKGSPQFEVVSSGILSGSLFPGGSGKIFVDVRNIGDEKGEETSVRIFENADYPLSFDEKTNFIGTIYPGAIGRAIFDLDVDGDANVKNYLVKIQVRSINRGNVIVSGYTIPLVISSPEKSSGMVFVLIVIAIILLIILAYLLIKAYGK